MGGILPCSVSSCNRRKIHYKRENGFAKPRIVAFCGENWLYIPISEGGGGGRGDSTILPFSGGKFYFGKFIVIFPGQTTSGGGGMG